MTDIASPLSQTTSKTGPQDAKLDVPHDSRAGLRRQVQQTSGYDAQSNLLSARKPSAVQSRAAEGAVQQKRPDDGAPGLQYVHFRGIALLEQVLAGQTLVRYGCSDKVAVKAIQEALRILVPSYSLGKPDGAWGPATNKALKLFQASKEKDGTSDGIIGKTTMRWLDNAASGGGAVPAPKKPAPKTPGNVPGLAVPKPESKGTSKLSTRPSATKGNISALRAHLLTGGYDRNGAYGEKKGDSKKRNYHNAALSRLLTHYVQKWLAERGASVSMNDALKRSDGGKKTPIKAAAGHPNWITHFQNTLISLAPKDSGGPNAWNEDADAAQRLVSIYLSTWQQNIASKESHQSVDEFGRHMGESLGNEQASEAMANGATISSTNKTNWCNQASNSILMLGLMRNGIAVHGINPIGAPWNGSKFATAPVLRFLRQNVNALAGVLPRLKAEGNAPLKPGDMIDILNNRHKENCGLKNRQKQSEGHRVTVASATGSAAHQPGQTVFYMSGNADGMNRAKDAGAVRFEQITEGAQTDVLKSLPNCHAKIKNVTRASQLRIDLLKKDGKLTPDARNLGFKEFNLVNHFARTELERQKLREIFKDLPGL